LAYGSTSTDVIGNSAIFVRVVDRKSGTELLSKEYTGSYTEGMTKLSCDTPETKAKMVEKSLKVALEELKSDLKTVGFSNDKVASVVVGNYLMNMAWP